MHCIEVYTLYPKRRYRMGLNECRTISNEKKPEKRKVAKLESREDVLMITIVRPIYIL